MMRVLWGGNGSLKPAVAVVTAMVMLTFSGSASAYTERTHTYHTDAACTLQATVCLPDTGTGHPCIMLIHEGGFTRGSRFCFAPYGEFFTDRGFAACAIDYRPVQEGGAYPAALNDCIRALRWLTGAADTLGIDSGRIVLMGSSAGAYLAVMTSLAHALPGTVVTDPATVPRPAGVISSFGLYDWDGLKWRGDGFLPAGQERAASPLTYAGAARCPYLLLAGERDRLFGFKQAKRFAAAVTAAGGTAAVRVMPKAGHQGICDPDGPLMRWALPDVERFLNTLRAAGR